MNGSSAVDAGLLRATYTGGKMKVSQLQSLSYKREIHLVYYRIRFEYSTYDKSYEICNWPLAQSTVRVRPISKWRPTEISDIGGFTNRVSIWESTFRREWDKT